MKICRSCVQLQREWILFTVWLYCHLLFLNVLKEHTVVFIDGGPWRDCETDERKVNWNLFSPFDAASFVSFFCRDTLGKCFFLRVEITLRGATYRISFSDTDQLPPPFRIDNFSKVSRGVESQFGCFICVREGGIWTALKIKMNIFQTWV